MNQNYELPHAVDAEKELLSALLIRNGEKIPAVAAIVSAEDFYRPEHRIIYRAILNLYVQRTPPNIISVFEELRRTDEIGKIDMKYLLSIAEISFTNAYAVAHAKIVKEKSELRRLMEIAEKLYQAAQQGFNSSSEIIAEHQSTLEEINRARSSSKNTAFVDYFGKPFDSDITEMKEYTDRKTGFENIDAVQFLTPGLYVIGATPAAGKTTFCWQLLEQLARKGENCVYCSYEMSRLELFSKSLTRTVQKKRKHGLNGGANPTRRLVGRTRLCS